jgi:hypothetical protein
MQHTPTRLLAFAALTIAISAGPAAAGGAGCCSCAVGCPPLVAVVPAVTEPFYIVNQGPDYTGPGIVLVPGYIEVDTAPATYPYVGRDYGSHHRYVLVPGGGYAEPRIPDVHRHYLGRHKHYRVHVSVRRAGKHRRHHHR